MIVIIEIFIPSDEPIFFKVEMSPFLLRPNLKFSPTEMYVDTIIIDARNNFEGLVFQMKSTLSDEKLSSVIDENRSEYR